MSEPPKKKSKTSKESKDSKADAPAITYAERLNALCPIANPLASEKMTKRLHKLVKKATGVKGIRRGVKEVAKALRRNEKGICILAGDISPIDIIAHLPIYCEEKDIPYMYVPSKQDLGAAACTSRPTSVVMVLEKAKVDDRKPYEKLHAELKEALPAFK